MVIKSTLVYYGYWLSSLAVLVNVIYELLALNNSRGLSPSVMMAFGLLILSIILKILALLVLFGEDIFRAFKASFNYFFQKQLLVFFLREELL